jgi:hypothetical protein
MHTVSFSINYWSRGQVQALFLRHEGYLGAIGAFLKGAEEYGELCRNIGMKSTAFVWKKYFLNILVVAVCLYVLCLWV